MPDLQVCKARRAGRDRSVPRAPWVSSRIGPPIATSISIAGRLILVLPRWEESPRSPGIWRNPSLELGIDGAADGRDPNLSDRRVASVRDALMQAGVPAAQIRIGQFANPDVRRFGQVEVLLKTRA